MMETGRLVGRHLRLNRMLLEIIDRSLHIVDQQRTCSSVVSSSSFMRVTMSPP